MARPPSFCRRRGPDGNFLNSCMPRLNNLVFCWAAFWSLAHYVLTKLPPIYFLCVPACHVSLIASKGPLVTSRSLRIHSRRVWLMITHACLFGLQIASCHVIQFTAAGWHDVRSPAYTDFAPIEPLSCVVLKKGKTYYYADFICCHYQGIYWAGSTVSTNVAGWAPITQHPLYHNLARSLLCLMRIWRPVPGKVE